MRLGAIDIGSNAVRLLVADVFEKKGFNDLIIHKEKMYRVPVRLGADTFSKGHITDVLIEKLAKAMTSFRLIMEIYEVEDYRAFATSALREADNVNEVLKKVEQLSKIHIRSISGSEEAALILSNKLESFIDRRFNHLFVDVGGGSTEISLLTSQGVGISKSFKMGTLRVLDSDTNKKTWKKMGEWLQENIKHEKPLAVIGSGGNINSIFKRSHHQDDYPLFYNYIKQERNLLAALTFEERMVLQELSADRADVIIPALDIFLFIMEQTDIKQVLVPKFGLADGIIQKLYKQKMRIH